MKRIKQAAKALQVVALFAGTLALAALGYALIASPIGIVAAMAGAAGALLGLKVAAITGLVSVALSLTYMLAKETALLLNKSESIRAKRAYCSENFKQFVEKFVNKDGFSITQHQKQDRELHKLYLSYKYSVLSITAQ